MNKLAYTTFDHTITIMKDNIKMDSTIAESMNDHSWLKITKYNWNIVESGYKHHNPDPYPKDRYSLQIKSQLIFRFKHLKKLMVFMGDQSK